KKKEFQTNQAAVLYFATPALDRIFLLATNVYIPPRGIEELTAMREEERQKVLERFNLFFAFTPAEKEKILRTLSEPERQQIEQTLRKYQSLPASQRTMCLQSFEKLACMSPGEQQQFLKNATHWQQMTPTERQKWKELVDDLSAMPPFPPDFSPPPPARSTSTKVEKP